MAHKIVVYDRVSGAPVAHLDPDERLQPIQLAENLWLSVAPTRMPPLWFVESYQYRRRPDVEAEKADGGVYAEIAGEVCRISPEAWEDTRRRWKVSEEQTQALAQHHRGVPLSDLFPTVTLSDFYPPIVKPKRPRKIRQPQQTGVPATLEKAIAAGWKPPGGPRTLESAIADLLVDFPRSWKVRAFLGLIQERFQKAKWLQKDKRPLFISNFDIRRACHNKTGKLSDKALPERVSDEAVKDTVIEGRAAIQMYQVPLVVEQNSDSDGIIVRQTNP
jgi:hypothetical protein